MNTLLPKWSYVVLVFFGILSGIIYYALPPASEGLRGFTLNLATEVVGILITVLFIDAVIRRREERLQRRYRSVTLQQMGSPLKKHLSLLFAIYKASVEQKPDREISRVEDLFGDDYRTQLTQFDAASDSPPIGIIVASDNQNVPWIDYLYEECSYFMRFVEKIVDRYTFYLDPDTLDLVEQLRNSSFFELIFYKWKYESPQNQGSLPIFAGEGVSDVIREYTDTFTKLVGIYNEEASSENEIRVESHMWRNDSAPQIGSARVPHLPK